MKALIFDYGGTLDTNGLHWSHVLWEGYCTVREEYEQLNFLHAISWEDFREAYVHAERKLGKENIILPTDNFHHVLLKKVTLELEYLNEHINGKIEEEQLSDATKFIAHYCNEYVKGNIAKAKVLLEKFSSKYNLVLVSNFYGNIRTILQDYGLTHFSNVIESAEVGIRKPDPAIYQLGVEATGFSAEHCAVIGDSFGKDIFPAKQIGCKTVWLKGKSWDREEVDENVPDHIITSIDQLLEIF